MSTEAYPSGFNVKQKLITKYIHHVSTMSAEIMKVSELLTQGPKIPTVQNKVGTDHITTTQLLYSTVKPGLWGPQAPR